MLFELEELGLRSRNPEDPAIPGLAASLWNYYRPKIPNSTEVIAGILNQFNVPGPWNVPEVAAGEADPLAAAAAAGGIWTPEAESAGQPSKLWLPGE
jgi:hypothetical protein